MLRRRRFIALLAAVASAGVLAACAKGGAPNATPDPEDSRRFLSLSSLLTGFDDLDATVGALYLGSIRSDAKQSATLDAIYAKAGYAKGAGPATLADLEKAGIFQKLGMLDLTNDILQNWYSGMYLANGALTSAVWADALAWRSCTFTKPPSYCGGPAYWAKLPAPA